MLKTFALRGRELPLTVYGPRGPARPLRGAAAGLRQPDLSGPDRRARAGRRARARTTTRSALSPSLTASRRSATSSDGGGAAGALRRRDGRCARRARRPRARRAPARRARRARRRATIVQPEQVLGPGRPGRTVVLTGDTAPTGSVVDAAAGADLLVHEATFCADERDRARETQHSTAAEAALAAQAAGVRLLALTHISSRYFGGEVAEEARQIFPDTVVPRDFDVVEIPFPERGAPVLVPRGATRAAARPPSPPRRRERRGDARLRRPRPRLRHAAADRRGLVGGLRRPRRAGRSPRPPRARRRLRHGSARRRAGRGGAREGVGGRRERGDGRRRARDACLPASGCGRRRPSSCRSATAGSTA